MSKVSVIIPTYNRADVLPRAMNSVLDGTFDEFELLVVDDASTDGTADVVAAYDDDRIRYVAHETNRGGSAARNTGIEHANGEYVAFLDSDDVWHPSKLDRQLERVEGSDRDWVGAYCDFEREISGPSGRLQTLGARLLDNDIAPERKEGDRELRAEILADNLVTCAGSTLLVERDVARRVGGFDETLDRCQDPEFVFRIVGEGPVAYVDEPLVTLHGTGAPAADVVERAHREFVAKYPDEVERAEAAGYAVTDNRNFLAAKAHFADGNVRRGAALLRRSNVEPGQVPGLLWVVTTGLRRRAPASAVTVIVALVALAGLVAGVAHVRRRDGDDGGAPPDPAAYRGAKRNYVTDK